MLRDAPCGQQNDGGTEMSIDWQNGAPDRGRTALPESYKPRALRLATAAPVAQPEPFATAGEPGSEEPVPPAVDLRKLEEELGRRRLDEIADVVRTLTYGEMMELASSVWNVRPDGSELTESNLPSVLYRWSTSRQS
jgi:hypothetical protein